MASLFGLQAMKASIEGVAGLDLRIGGSWAENAPVSPAGFSLPKVTGTVQLRNVRATVRGTNDPIEISSAELKLLPDEARVEKLLARAADADWTGSMIVPRSCGIPGACLVYFNLNTDDLGLISLCEWLGPQPSERRWYQLLTPAQPGAASFLGNLRASGKVNARRLRIHNVVAERVSASVELERGKVKVSGLRAELLGGKHRGDWQADFTASIPVYGGSGTLTAVSLEQLADAMHHPWISGTGGATYQFKASGATFDTFWQSVDAGFHFELRDGVLPHISLASDGAPLQFAHWQGLAELHDGKIEMEKAVLISPGGAYEVNGTASVGQVLDFKLAAGTEVKAAGAGSFIYSITGTVAEPRVALTPTPETQAQLKP
jgi:hypothetical protein